MWAVVSGATSEPRRLRDGCAFPLLLFLPFFFLLLHSLLLLLLLPPLLSSPISFPVILSCCWLVPQSCPILCDPMDCCLPGSSVHGDSPGKNTGVGCHALLQGISPTQGWNPGLPISLLFLMQNTEVSKTLQIRKSPGPWITMTRPLDHTWPGTLALHS